MEKKELLKQLHNLKNNVRPDASWKASNREILLSQIKAQTSGVKNEKALLWQGLIFKKILAVAYKPVVSIILIIGIVFGGYTMTVSATKNSLPGDFLYPIKLTGERMKVNMAATDEEKASLEIEFAQRRLEEMKKVADKSDSDSVKKENIQVSLKKYQESINNVKSSLSKLEKTDTAAAIKVAKLVDEKTQNYVEILNVQKEKIPEGSIIDKAKDAIAISKITADKALEMIINEYKAGSKEVTRDMVIQKLEKKLADLSFALDNDTKEIDKIIVNMALAKQLKDSAAAKALADKEKATEVKPLESTTSTDNNSNVNASAQGSAPIEAPKEVLPIPEVVKPRLVEVKNLLDQAKAYLSTKELLWSYARMKEAQEILTLAEKVIEANKQYLEEPKPAASEQATNKEETSNVNVNAASGDEKK